jgi:hypothetical protein
VLKRKFHIQNQSRKAPKNRASPKDILNEGDFPK